MRMSDVVSQLRAARALIADPYRWCTGEFARDAEGRAVWPSDGGAHRFCAIGALMHIRGETQISSFVDNHYVARNWLRLAAEEMHPTSRIGRGGVAHSAYVNDFVGHAAALQMYDRAIELAVASQNAPPDVANGTQIVSPETANAGDTAIEEAS